MTTSQQDRSSELLLVPTKVLLPIAAAVWFCAGMSVVMVGVRACPGAWTIQMAALALAVFVPFLALFMRLAQVNVSRICDNPRKLSFVLSFFDTNSYIVMTVMMITGAAVRISTFVPDYIIAFFYSGLGAALFFAGFYPAISYIKTWNHPHFTKR